MKIEHQNLDVKRESMEKEKESLNKSDAVALKRREAELITELNGQQKNLGEKQRFLEQKQTQYQDAQNQIKTEEDRKYEKEKELEELIEEMQDEADTMAFEEHAFMEGRAGKNIRKNHTNSIYTSSNLITQKKKLMREQRYWQRQIVWKDRRMI